MRRKLPKPTVELPQSFDLTSECRRHAKIAIKTLLGVLKSKSAGSSSKIKAAQEILNRAYGKAPITIDITQHLDGDALAKAASAILEERRRKALIGENAPPMQRSEGVGVRSGSPTKEVTSPITPKYIEDKKEDN